MRISAGIGLRMRISDAFNVMPSKREHGQWVARLRTDEKGQYVDALFVDGDCDCFNGKIVSIAAPTDGKKGVFFP